MADRSDDEVAASTLVEETLDEHSGCMKLVAEVEQCLDRPPEDPERWIAELQLKLTALRSAMASHFEGEEAGPIFRKLPRQYPRLANGLARLEAEHPEMLEDISSVLRRAGELRDPQKFELRELNARVQLFVARLRRHEAAENEMVLQAYWDEIGEGD